MENSSYVQTLKTVYLSQHIGGGIRPISCQGIEDF